ncbi:MAG: Uma2 family endonuclease [Actinomycetota bacterium]|jgi:Uma2 family endonuclease|nr:Uma2 family endonuclease [Actinomycetota bacterium]
MAVRILRWAFDVDEYHRMAEVGVLSEDDRVELLEGEIAEMSPIRGRHQGCVNRLARLLFEIAGRDYVVHVQGPVRLNERSEPQPDLALLKPRPDFYSEGHPTPRVRCCSSRSRSPRRTTTAR